MDNELKIKLYSFTMDCKDPHELAKFYAALLKWESLVIDEDWACLCQMKSIIESAHFALL